MSATPGPKPGTNKTPLQAEKTGKVPAAERLPKQPGEKK